MKRFLSIKALNILFLMLFSVCCFSCQDEPDTPIDIEEPTPDTTGDKIIVPDVKDLTQIVTQDGGSTTIAFIAKEAWRATVSYKEESSDWISISQTGGNAGDIKLTVTLEPNDTPEDRIGYVTITSTGASRAVSEQTYEIRQKQRDALTVSPSKLTLDACESKFEIEVQANIEFEVEVKADWIEQIQSRAMTTTMLSFTAKTNFTGEERTGTIIIRSNEKSETITLAQDYISLVVERDVYNLDSQAQQININVSCKTSKSTHIEYYITKGIEWISHVDTRSVSSEFIFNVDENTTDSIREGEIEFTLSDSISVFVSIIQSSNNVVVQIPDPNFLAYCLENFDTNNDGLLSIQEVSVVTTINVDNKNIQSLEGIEYFTSLTELRCIDNKLTSLDLSKNTQLTELRCIDNKLTTLDLSKNTLLTVLNCYNNFLTSLDLSKNTQLTELWCFGNSLHNSLDLSKNTQLTELSCGGTYLTSLDLSKNTQLTFLDCDNNELTYLDLSNNTQLTKLDCNFNRLTSLDLSKNTQLTTLSCYYNNLTSLDLSKNTLLTELCCGANQLTSLDLSNCTQLTTLECFSNQLTSLDLSNYTQLTMLDCRYNQLTSLDLSKNTLLTELRCNDNQLTSLDLSKNTQLTMLYCYTNRLTSLDLSKNTQLTFLDCDNNELTYLDLSNNTLLTVLYCDNNELTYLDLSNNTLLTTIFCNMYTLQTLKLNNMISPRIISKLGQTEIIYVD